VVLEIASWSWLAVFTQRDVPSRMASGKKRQDVQLGAAAQEDLDQLSAAIEQMLAVVEHE
jgi:hypothetical protein